MKKKPFKKERSVKKECITSDLVVIGGGMSGVCCALTAARAGLNVTLVQDRPVLGGNASSEVRLWILGATSSMGNNNRWAREGGVIDEILVENLYRNKEGNSVIFDTILLEKVQEEPNITLLLNTSVFQTTKTTDHNIERVTGFCSQNSTQYKLEAPLFCDASGDGIVAFQAGAPFRMGAEDAEEFDEGFAPNVEDYGELLGHSIYFHTKDTGKPVRFVAPSYALKNIADLPRIKNYRLQDDGCRLWWVEYGGRLDTIHQSEEIKWELWKVVYGIWDYVKNSGNYPEAETMTLEWVGTIPGKRESRRFEGDYMLTQKDIVEQKYHKDAVAFGGWSLDLHPADGIYSDKRGCNQWHSKGVYQIPYRCFYSKSIDNLFLAGRIISASHVAFGSTRVMATCAHGAQAVGMAAVLASKYGITPRELTTDAKMEELQRALNKQGQSIPHIPLDDPHNLSNSATLEASNELVLQHLPDDGPWLPLTHSSAQMLPFKKGQTYTITLQVRVACQTGLNIQLRTSSKLQNYTPDVLLQQFDFSLKEGSQKIDICFDATLEDDQYAFICLMKNESVEIKCSEKRVSGLLSVFNKTNEDVSNYGRQDPPKDIGVEPFEFWIPERRPKGHNFSFEIEPAIQVFSVSSINNGSVRPTHQPNCWISSLQNESSWMRLKWKRIRQIKEIILMFDTDFDNPLESTLRGHSEDRIPFCVENYNVLDEHGEVRYQQRENYQTINKIVFEEPVRTSEITIEIQPSTEHINATNAVFEVLCYEE